MDPSTREILKREFETDIKVLVEQFQASIRRVQLREKDHTKVATIAVTRNKVDDACMVLHMDPPEWKGGQVVVDMGKARSQKKLLARSYHSDLKGSDPVLHDKFLAVIEAFQILETYSKQEIVPKP